MNPRIPSSKHNTDEIIPSNSLEEESKLGPINKYGIPENMENLICAWPIHVKEIPRVAMDPSQPTEIHVFSDAFSVVYAASVYVIQENEASL
uniref:RT_RNaseH_2 domain-containing protein n=1 Tax=Loa loa TaxID=7209 RepID=A0A1I7V742_LOALO